MKSFLLVFALVAGSTMIGGCFLQETIFGADNDDVIRGRVSFGFEEAAFRPCSSDEQWWITGSNKAVSELQEDWTALGLNWYEAGYAEIRGNKTARGSYGHVGAYQREIDVKEVVEVRLLEDGECAWPQTK